MNRRQFLKRSLEGVVAVSIPLIYGCGKNPSGFNTEERSVKNLYLFLTY